MIAADELESYLHDHIPLTAAMDVEVVAVDRKSLSLAAPLGPNINHRETVFGGSASALGILAAWCVVHVGLKEEVGILPRIVIQRNTMEYEKPILSRFMAVCDFPEAEHWSRFLRSIRKRGRGRIRLVSVLTCDGDEVGRLEGTFVAFDMGKSPV